MHRERILPSSLEYECICSCFFYLSGTFPYVNPFRTQLYWFVGGFFFFFFVCVCVYLFIFNKCATIDSLFISLNLVFCLVRIGKLDTHLNDLLCIVRAVFN